MQQAIKRGTGLDAIDIDGLSEITGPAVLRTIASGLRTA